MRLRRTADEKRRLVAAGAAEVHEAPVLGQVPRGGRRRDTEHRVEHDVERPVLGQRRRHRIDVALEGDDDVRAGGRRSGHRRGPRHRHHGRGAEHPCDTDRRPGRRRHRHPGSAPARRAAAARATTAPSTPRCPTARSPRPARPAPPRRWGRRPHRGLRTRPPATPSPGFIPAVAKNHTRVPASTEAEDSTTPTPWPPGTYGVCGHPEVRRPGRTEQVERHDRCRSHPHHRRPRGGSRRRVLAVRRRPAGRVEDGRSHVAMSG